ncbi:chromosome segregation SMC family protein [Nesterenkonia alkaliphila]|uniref:chromosome segregation SMC family protein n=1 Tax=Nesterenkonia alkaliphila TaxID=1463631 RepID=UPI0016677ECD|nr:AAA family ATPase [Nesterenkonia alkaliphila]GFZ96697.1 chromosome partition protein Smc [Nesterenkonia alkaliphila]
MHLKTLTIRGFKSFASATTFEFEPGVTAVVGPNGSGKSNVVDALAWVMGEQGAKSLRGGSMEDVIFAGTAERQPLGRASVSLTIDNTDGALPIDYTEVTISRTMFRSGGSEYTINGTKCRLLDIQELLSDSGLGREMHVIVGQGQLDQILQATPEQRRGFIEEAAGVLKHRRRRERSVRKLESMQTNLERLEDLIGEISRQLAPLGRQAKVARRAQRIQHDVRDALSRLIADDLVAAASALHASSQGEQEDHDAAGRLKSALADYDAQLTELNTQAEAQRSRAEKLAGGHHRLSQAQERLRSVASLAAERARNLRSSTAEESFTGRGPQALREQAEQVAAEAQAQRSAVEQAQQALEQIGKARAEAEEALKAEETRITEQLRAVADRRAGLATLQGRVETAQGRADAAGSRRRRATQQQEAEQVSLENSQAELAELEQRIAEIETGEAQVQQDYQAAQQHYQQRKAAHDELVAQQRRLEITVSETRAKLSALESAIAAAQEPVKLNEPGAAFSVEVVQADQRIEGSLRSALVDVVLVDDKSFGTELVSSGEAAAALALDKVVIRQGERISGDSSGRSQATLSEQVEQLHQTLAAAERELEQVSGQVQRSQAEVGAAELAVNETSDAVQVNQTALASAGEQLARLKRETGRAQERIAGFTKEIQEAEASAADAAEQLREVTARLQAAENEDLVEEPSTSERDRLSEQASAQRRDEVDARLALRAAEEQHKQLLDRAAGLRRSAQSEEHRREQARRAAAARSEKAEQADQIAQEAHEAVEGIEEQLAAVLEAKEGAQRLHAQLKSQAAEILQERTGAAQQLEEVTNRLHQAELKQTELRLAMEAAEARAEEELSLTPEYLIEHYGPDQPVPETEADEDDLAAAVPYVRAEQERRLAAARRDLKALGKVNPLALEEHAALEERHSYLQGQLADLKKSRQDLLDIIAEVDSTVHKVFSEAWEDTRVQFERVFARLFPGGEGRIELTNPEDMLNTGIEVHARPPGKRIRRLSLLSGGERSLTAVALLVAIFKARPSPFYVMDEVEAALDDTNLSRLLVIFEELRESSQLIVITHQKRTMEIADALYGVSMRQDGSTRVVSQRLRQETAA